VSGDPDLYRIVERLVLDLTHQHKWPNGMGWGARPNELPPTPRELCVRLDQVCEITKRIIQTRYADSERAAMAEKLRAMTVANGCRPAEAATALLKLQQLGAV
jgi:hypothetical protein